MGRLFIDILDGGPAPKRGDLVQTNVGDRRERTWLVLRSRLVRRRNALQPFRFAVWMARWWELEPSCKMRLYMSAERHGGQQVIYFKRYPAKKRSSFEQYMRRKVNG